MIEIIRADSQFMRRRFYAFSHHLYRENPLWQEPALWGGKKVLSSLHNSMMREPHQLLMAMEDGKPLARVAVGRGYFTLFDAYPHPEAVQRLFQAAARCQRSWGCSEMVGPIAPCPLEAGGGVLVEGFSEPAPLFDVQNAPYYGPYLEQCGFEKQSDELVYRVSSARFDREKFRKTADWACGRFGLRVEKDVEKQPRRLAEILWRVMDGVNEPRALSLVHALFPYLAEGMCPAVLDARGNPAGFLLSLRKGDGRVRVATLWVAAGWRRKGAECVLLSAFMDGAGEKGVLEADAASVREDNQASRKSIEAAGGVPVRRYRRYRMNV